MYGKLYGIVTVAICYPVACLLPVLLSINTTQDRQQATNRYNPVDNPPKPVSNTLITLLITRHLLTPSCPLPIHCG